MAGFDNDVMYAINADFSNSTGGTGASTIGELLTDGQMWIGSTVVNAGGTHINVGKFTSPGGTISIGYSSPNITLDLAGGSAAVEHLTGDSGGQLNPTANNFNIFGLSGSKTSGSGSTITIKSPPFSQVGGVGTSVLNTGEIVTAAVTRTLPASAGIVDGDLFIYICTTAGQLTIQAVGSQKIRIGSSLSSAAGTAKSNAIGDSLTLRFDATQGFFMAVSVIGTWTLA